MVYEAEVSQERGAGVCVCVGGGVVPGSRLMHPARTGSDWGDEPNQDQLDQLDQQGSDKCKANTRTEGWEPGG